MPSATAPGFLLDAYGRAAVYGGQGNLHRRTAEDDDKRPPPPSHFADYRTLFSPHRYRELVTECRHLGTRSLVAALLENRADYVAASHYAPVFEGADEAWGTEATAALLDALKLCNLRGPRFDWRTTWRLSSPTRATDGSWFILLTEWPDSGMPALQVFEGHRIGQRDTSEGLVGKSDAFTITADGKRITGAYAGLPINQGIIYNAQGYEVAYRVLGADPDGRDDQDISARDMIHVARPRHFSEGRPAPDLAPAVLDLVALDLAQTAQLDQQIIDAMQTVVESNGSGKYDPSANFRPNGQQEKTEVYTRGSTKFIKSGYEAKPWQTERPSDQWMNFDWRVGSRAAAALRWRLEMLDPSKLGGVNGRAFQDQINTAIADEFAIDYDPCVRVIRYFVAKLIKRRVIPNHEEARLWGVAQPPWFEVDRNSGRLDLEDVAAGRTAMSILHGRDGRRTIDILRARAHTFKQALAVAKENPDVPFAVILGDQGATASRSGFYPQQDPKATPPPDGQPDPGTQPRQPGQPTQKPAA